MRVIVALSALVCAAFAVPDVRFKRDLHDFESMKNTCTGKCFNHENYSQKIAALTPKGRQMAQSFRSAGQRPNMPNVEAQELEQLCSDFKKVKECVSKCGNEDLKPKAIAILTAGSDLACDPELKANIGCLSTLEFGDVSPACETQCTPLFNPVMDDFSIVVFDNGTINWAKVKNAATGLCKLVKCGLKCSKELIIQKCQAAGYNAVKTGLKKASNFAQVVHSQFRPAANFPAECKADAVLAGA